MLSVRRRTQVLEKVAFMWKDTQPKRIHAKQQVGQAAADGVIAGGETMVASPNDAQRMGRKARVLSRARSAPPQRPNIPHETQQRRMAASDARIAARPAPINFAKSTYKQRIAAKKTMGGKAWKKGMNTWWGARRDRMAKSRSAAQGAQQA